MARISRRDTLFVLTTLAGAAFVATRLESRTLDFRAFPALAPAFREQRGFFDVLRWAESLRSAQDVDVLMRMVSRSAANASCAAATVAGELPSPPPPPLRPSEPFHVQLVQIAAFETYVHASKALLQCGLLLFLHRLQTLPRRRAVPTICLCVLLLGCWKMAQACLREVVATRNPRASGDAAAAEMTAALLSTLFLLRFAGAAVVNGVLGRAYQLHFCAPWPEAWRRVPRYLGSKNLALSTLYYAAAVVAAVSASCAALRSLSEAALQLETAALSCSLLHFVFFRIARERRPKHA